MFHSVFLDGAFLLSIFVFLFCFCNSLFIHFIFNRVLHLIHTTQTLDSPFTSIQPKRDLMGMHYCTIICVSLIVLTKEFHILTREKLVGTSTVSSGKDSLSFVIWLMANSAKRKFI